MSRELPINPLTGERAIGFRKNGAPIFNCAGGSGSNAAAGDAIIRRLQTEFHEKEVFANSIMERAEAGNRDLSDDDKGLLVETRERMESIKDQIENVEALHAVASQTRQRAAQVDAQIQRDRGVSQHGPIEFRSAGDYSLTLYMASQGNRKAKERLELYQRAGSDGGVDHTTTTDMEGVIPDPILGPVLNFIDSARPLVSALGPRPLPGMNWHRPRVTQHTTVAKQTGEKEELVNQRMKVERLPVSADTYGGFANVSKQLADFSSPDGVDLVINDLAANYAIETEAATCDAVAATATTAIDYDGDDAPTVNRALWAAVAAAYAAVKGQGRILLVCSPGAMGIFGPLFPPINPQNAVSQGFNAAQFAQGVMGNISGVTTLMSAGFTANEAFVVATAGVEVYEQRIGTLQVTEPSVLGMQVAYAGYFANLVIDEAAIIPLNNAGS
jgi:HK97 family phage major capsid protein